MSTYKSKKSEKHKVKHVFSGKKHFYEVTTPDGNVHQVNIQISCDCRYMAVQGIANGKACSDVLAVFKAIIKAGEMNLK